MEYKSMLKCHWVKYGGWPLWPCRIAAEREVGPKLSSGRANDDQLLVKFFGTPDEYAWVQMGNVKKFTLQSINALNPLFHSLSDRKLYESALKEVIAWYKTRPEDRVIPVWKPGDEDTQGDGTFTSEESNEEDGSVVYDEWDYVDVGTSSVQDSSLIESTFESYDDPPQGGKKSHTVKSPPRSEHKEVKLKSTSGRLTHATKHQPASEKTNHHSKREEHRAASIQVANGKQPPNKIVSTNSNKRRVDLVDASVSMSPKKHKQNEINNNYSGLTNNNTTKPNNSNMQSDNSITQANNKYEEECSSTDDEYKEQDRNAKHNSNQRHANTNSTSDKQHLSKQDSTESSKPHVSPSRLLNAPSSPSSSNHKSNKNTKGNEKGQRLLLQINNSDTEDEISVSNKEVKKQQHNSRTEHPAKERRTSQQKDSHTPSSHQTHPTSSPHITSHTSSPHKKSTKLKDLNNNDGNHSSDNSEKNDMQAVTDCFVPDTPTRETLEDVVTREVAKEREKMMRLVAEQLDKQIEKALDSQLHEMVNKIVEEKLQDKADKLWDQQTAFEDKMKNYIKNELVGVRKEVSNMHTELEKNLHVIEQNNRSVTQVVISLLKDTIVKLEQHCK